MAEQVTFNINNLNQQSFPFSKKQIKYILENSNASVIQKLYRTCKYFYFNKPYFIVDTLDFEFAKGRFENEKYDGCMDIHEPTDLNLINNIWITKEINIVSSVRFQNELNTKIVRCTAKKIEISSHWFTKGEFEILTKSGTIEELVCDSLEITNSLDDFDGDDDSKVPIEEIFALVPNAKRITYGTCHVTPETMSKLLTIPWKQKLSTFSLEEVDGELNPEMYHKFVETHLENYGYTNIEFLNSEEHEKAFKRSYNAIIDDEADTDSDEYETLVKKRKLFVYDRQLPTSSKTKVEINFDETGGQSFSLPKPLIKYAIENANWKSMKKLYKTCKYFKNTAKFSIIDEIEMRWGENIISSSLDEMEFDNISEINNISNNIWITKTFHFDKDDLEDFHIIMAKVIRCDAEDVNIRYLEIKENEYQILTKSKNVIRWHSNFSPIINEKKNFVPIENLIPNLINANEIALYNCYFTSKTFDKLLSLPWKNQIKELWLNKINLPINAEKFYEFLKVAVAPRAYAKIIFDELSDETYHEKFDAAIKIKLDTWIPKREKPSVAVMYLEDTTMVQAGTP